MTVPTSQNACYMGVNRQIDCVYKRSVDMRRHDYVSTCITREPTPAGDF